MDADVSNFFVCVCVFIGYYRIKILLINISRRTLCAYRIAWAVFSNAHKVEWSRSLLYCSPSGESI